MIRRGGAEGTMRHLIRPTAALILAGWLTAGPVYPARQEAPAKPPGGTWTLRDCIAAALARNLDLSIEALNPDLGEADIEATKEQYLPQFNLSYYKYDQTQPSSWGVEGTAVQTSFDNYSLVLSERIVTGTTAQLSFTNNMTDTSRAFTVVNPAYNSTFAFTLTQSLLKGFGPKVNRIPTVQAENRREMMVSSLKGAVLQTVYGVEEAYWSLVSAIENRKVQEASLEQSRALLEKNREAVRIGTKSALDILNSEAEVAQYEDALVQARLNVEQTEARLKQLMNLPAGGEAEVGAILPSDRPGAGGGSISAEEALRTALEKRPEMIQSGLEIANYEQTIASTRNDLLPQLDLTLQAWSPGQSGVLYLYDNGNPLTGNLIGKVEGSRAEALKQAMKMTYKTWSLKLDLSVPMSKLFTRSSLAIARMNKDQAELRRERQKQAIEYEIADAVKTLRNAERRIESSRAARELQEKRVAAETQRVQLGLVGSEWLLSYQRQLTNARTSEISALVSYKIARAKLEKAMGTTIESLGLKFRDYVF
jgi:outer membrane protein TolC